MKAAERHTLCLMVSFLRLRHISAARMCCKVSLAKRKRSFSSLGAADAQAAGPKRFLSSSICLTIPGHQHKNCVKRLDLTKTLRNVVNKPLKSLK